MIEMESYLEDGAATQVSDAEATQLDMTDEEATVCEQEDVTVSTKKNSVGMHSREMSLLFCQIISTSRGMSIGIFDYFL